MKRRQIAARKNLPGKTSGQSGDDLVQQRRARAVAFLHRTLGNREVARLAARRDLTPSPGGVSIQRQDSEYITRMKEAFRKGGITQEMITGQRTDGFIDYDEEKGVARWVPIQFAAPVPKPKESDATRRMNEAFRKAGITKEMITGERTDGFIDYDEETGVARWVPVSFPKPDDKDEIKRMQEAFRKGGITQEMITGERTDGVIIYDEVAGTARWEKITFPALESKPDAGRKLKKK